MPHNARNGMILAAMCLATFIAILDTSLVNLGLHSIQADLHSSMSTLQWVINLYSLAYAVLILTGGTLGDLFGRRRIFILGVLTFAVGSLICAIAPGAAVLIAGRGIAGVGAALQLPAAQRRAWAIALWGGMNGLAMALGPTAGGLLVDSFGWRSLFYVILPFAVATVALAVGYVAESASPQGRRLDLPGQFLTIVTLGTLSLGFIEGSDWGWRSPAVLGCFAVSIIGLRGFFSGRALVAWAAAAAVDLPQPCIFRRGSRRRADDLWHVWVVVRFASLFQMIQQDSAVMAGVGLLPMSVTFFLVSLVAGRAATRVGPRALISCGMALTGTGMLLLSSPIIRAGYSWVAAALFAVGLGLGLITGPIATAAMANAPAARSGLSSGLVNVGRWSARRLV